LLKQNLNEILILIAALFILSMGIFIGRGVGVKCYSECRYTERSVLENEGTFDVNKCVMKCYKEAGE
jgi:hypothetical protein